MKMATTCTVTPDPAPVGSTVTVTASGMPTDQESNLAVTKPDGTVTVLPLGTVGSYTNTFTVSEAGAWQFKFTGPVKAPSPTRPLGNAKVLAQCSVQVQ